MLQKMTKNLFHVKTLNQALQIFKFPDDLITKQEKITNWIASLQGGILDEIKETSLHGQFFNDIFQEILGYRPITATKGKSWEIHAEASISDGGGSADGALGFFTATENQKGKVKLEGKIIAPIELKGAKINLDRPLSGKKESAVDQGWRYANYTPNCQWVIVSNYREIRLYHTNKTPAYYEQFFLTDLADLDQFKKFYFLLCRQNFLPSSNKSNQSSKIDLLLIQSNEKEEEITKQLYQEYRQVRLDLVQHFKNTASLAISNRDQVLIEKAQKTLDRLLFIAFCEDKGLLPKHIIKQAHDHQDIFNPRPIWHNYKAVFRWVDQGNDDPLISGYNGGLFKHDPLLDEDLQVSDLLCSQLKQLTRFDFDTEVSVNILGHIFEQSITDLEELKALAKNQAYNQKKGKRKTQGVFYTPAFITQYIVEISLGSYLSKQEEELRNKLQFKPVKAKLTKQEKALEIKFWETYRDQVLKKTKILDPACGSGAFLIAAFDYLAQKYEEVNQILADLTGEEKTIFDLSKTILNCNLYGVDLSPESVEITKLSLWLKTARPGQTLTDLDHNIKVGNSIIADPNFDPNAFNWDREFPDILAEGGFDIIIGNPPYVRQELLSPLKPYLQQHYQAYHGVADLYTYFYEKGVKLLKNNGFLSYIVTNKWLKSGYGEALRKFFTETTIVEQIIDFGHAPIFEDAETFPCIIKVRKSEALTPAPSPTERGEFNVVICAIPKEELSNINLISYVNQKGFEIPYSRFNSNAWGLEKPEVNLLMEKIKNQGIPLTDFAGIKPYYGIKTGFNEAFLIDHETKNQLVKADPRSLEIIKPFLRGQDIKRWYPEWKNQWIIVTFHGINIDEYPAIKNYLIQYQKRLEPCPKSWDKKINGEWEGRKQGKYKWYELQDNFNHWQEFQQNKIVWQDLAFHSKFCFDNNSFFAEMTCFVLPSSDLYLLGLLNSPVIWYYLFNTTIHGANETLRLKNIYTETIPIADPTSEIRAKTEEIVSQLIEISKNNQQIYKDVFDWLFIEYKIEKLGRKLEDFASLSSDEFVTEIKKRQSKGMKSININQFRQIREAYDQYVPTIQQNKNLILTLELGLNDLINQAYQLTPEEIELMWKTAPPRMPINYQ